jgi:hypothetical protein
LLDLQQANALVVLDILLVVGVGVDMAPVVIQQGPAAMVAELTEHRLHVQFQLRPQLILVGAEVEVVQAEIQVVQADQG